MATYELIHFAPQSEYADEPLPLEENRVIGKIASKPASLQQITHDLLKEGAQFFCAYCQYHYWAGKPTDREWLRLNQMAMRRQRVHRRIAVIGALIITVLFFGIWYLRVPVLSETFMLVFFGLFAALSLANLAFPGSRRPDLIVLNRDGVTDEEGAHVLKQAAG